MAYIYNGEPLPFTVEQDGKVGDLVIQVVIEEPNGNIPGTRLHISKPDFDGTDYSGGDVLASVYFNQE